MSFDPRSLERLKELGRSLPEPIAPPQQNKDRPVKATEKRHRIETEDNPERLFQELMKASSDGTVPEHLMARLKEAERHVATQNKAKAKAKADKEAAKAKKKADSEAAKAKKKEVQAQARHRKMESAKQKAAEKRRQALQQHANGSSSDSGDGSDSDSSRGSDRNNRRRDSS